MSENCCTRTVNEHFARLSLRPDGLDDYLRSLCEEWGVITTRAFEYCHVRTTASAGLGVDAITGRLKCEEGCPNGGTVPFVFLGSRLFYFIFRMNLACATFWKVGPRNRDGVELQQASSNWPGEEPKNQLRLAVKFYFDGKYLTDEGFDKLKLMFLTLDRSVARTQGLITEFGELFTLLHELEHHFLAQEGEEFKQFRIKSQPSQILGLSQERAARWSRELECDANAFFMLLVAASSKLVKENGLAPDVAKTQAGSAICAGVDSALHALQYLEERKFGRVTLNDAVTNNAFRSHPPAQFRRDTLSSVCYRLITGQDMNSLLRGNAPASWRVVAHNTASHMQIWDRLFASYQPPPGGTQ